jgi:hypothetical protein
MAKPKAPDWQADLKNMMMKEYVKSKLAPKPIGVAIASPPTRMVVIASGPSGPPRVLPVLGVRCMIANEGYHEQELICWDDRQSDLIVHSELYGKGRSIRLVECPWPASEDAGRLAPFLAPQPA